MVKKLCSLMALLLVLLTSVSLAEGRVTDAQFNFVIREEFDRTYEILEN